MFEVFAIMLAFVCSTVAGIWDLFTTEVPDEIIAIMLSLGIFNWYVYAMSSGEFTPLLLSLLLGSTTLAVGLVLYRFGHWGGADAWLFAGIAYTIPIYGSRVFMFDYIFNFLIVSSAYMIIYVAILGIINRRVFSYFVGDVKSNWKIIFLVLVVPWSLLMVFYLMTYTIVAFPLLEMLLLVTVLVFFWRYAKVIDNRVFKKTIPASRLKPGDVLDDMIWKGMTKEDIARIKKSRKNVVIKEGVRLVPAFPITLALTLIYGNLMLYII